MQLKRQQVDRAGPPQVQFGSHSRTRSRSAVKIQLSAFIATSCLAHATLLLWAGHPPATQPHIGGHTESLTVTLVASATPSAAIKEVAALEVVPPRQAVQPYRRTVTAVQNHALRQPANPTTQQSAKPPAAPVTLDSLTTTIRPATSPPRIAQQLSSLNVSERVSAALQNQLAERFEYPWLARKRGWQGLVTLSLHVDENGAVSQWRIARTSGYSVLDRSALKAASHIDRLQQADLLLDGKSLNLSIPVRYRLIDS